MNVYMLVMNFALVDKSFFNLNFIFVQFNNQLYIGPMFTLATTNANKKVAYRALLTNKNSVWVTTHQQQDEDMQRNQVDDKDIAAPCRHLYILQ